MMERTIEDIGAKMDALGIWPMLSSCNWAIKPTGTVFPYFCVVIKGERLPIKVRVLLLEGWQTFQRFLLARGDRDFGFYTSPIEFPHFELVILNTGEMKLFRHDTGYMPVEANATQRTLVSRILWEVYGVMLRLESDPKLPTKYVNEQAIFARVEKGKGVWIDAPLAIPEPPPHTEKITFEKADLSRAKDLPLVNGEALHVDFRLLTNTMTKEVRPRTVYQLVGYEPLTKSLVIDLRASFTSEGGLKGLWEAMPSQLLKAVIARGKVPSEVKTCSGRVFRMLRPLCMELPIKLSLHDSLEGV